MNCPRGCAAPLQMTERHGVEVDYCPTCRGIWLDRGELDKILDRMEMQAKAGEPRIPQDPVSAPRPPEYDRRDDRRDDRREDDRDRRYEDDDRYRQHGKKKKREHWLSDIFDFD